MTEPEPSSPAPHRRRVRYSGRNPRQFAEKYKEHNPAQHPDTVSKIIASGKTPAGTHRPIMVEEVLSALQPAPGQVGCDATLGYGGHTVELLKKLAPGGHLIALDTDPLELPRTEERLRALGYDPDALTVMHTSFAGISRALLQKDFPTVDFILADLGLSSMQIDNPARGFTFKENAPLDLRLNPRKGEPASAWLARWSLPELTQIFADYGDELRPAEYAQRIVETRQRIPLLRTTDLATLLRDVTTGNGRLPIDPDEVNKSIQRLFQAIRIAVNNEMDALTEFLRQLPTCLKPGGRAAILTFHSGEDRRVKKAFEDGLQRQTYAEISTDPIRPTPEEVRANPRSRSAKLRWALKA